MKPTKQFYFQANYGLFLGRLLDNQAHQHYAQQISISCGKAMELRYRDIYHSAQTFFIPSQLGHQLYSPSPQMALLINPISRIGHYLQLRFGNDLVKNFEGELGQQLSDILRKFIRDKSSFAALCQRVDTAMEAFVCECNTEIHLEDDRILKAIHYLEEHFETVVALEDIATFCHLSPSRFLHLFKEKTQLNYRGYQRWNKLIKSLPALSQQSITKTAYQFGFSDSAHYTRTFKATFGVTPKFISNNVNNNTTKYK